MTNTQAILIGAALVAGAVFATAGHLSAQTYGVIGQYQLMHHSNASANAGVFRIDTTSGNVSYCYIAGNQSLTCTPEVK